MDALPSMTNPALFVSSPFPSLPFPALLFLLLRLLLPPQTAARRPKVSPLATSWGGLPVPTDFALVQGGEGRGQTFVLKGHILIFKTESEAKSFVDTIWQKLT